MQGTYWSSFGAMYSSSTSPIDDILRGDNPTLEGLLDEDEVIQECNNMNSQLVAFFARPEVLKTIITYITVFPKEEDSEKRKLKYPYVCCELLATSVKPVLDSLVDEDNHLMEYLFEFLDTDEELDCVLAGYFRIAISVLLQQKHAELVSFLQRNPSHLDRMIQHIGTHSIMELLLMIGWDDGNDINHDWLYHFQLVPKLVSKLAPECGEFVNNSASYALVDLVAKCHPTETYLLLAHLQSKDMVAQIAKHIFADNQSALISGLAVLIALVHRNANAIAAYEASGGMETPFQYETDDSLTPEQQQQHQLHQQQFLAMEQQLQMQQHQIDQEQQEILGQQTIEAGPDGGSSAAGVDADSGPSVIDEPSVSHDADDDVEESGDADAATEAMSGEDTSEKSSTSSKSVLGDDAQGTAEDNIEPVGKLEDTQIDSGKSDTDASSDGSHSDESSSSKEKPDDAATSSGGDAAEASAATSAEASAATSAEAAGVDGDEEAVSVDTGVTEADASASGDQPMQPPASADESGDWSGGEQKQQGVAPTEQDIDPLMLLMTRNSQTETGLPPPIEVVYEHLAGFEELLCTPPKEALNTQFGGLDPPVGPVRMKMVELLVALLRSNYPMVYERIASLRLITECIELFFTFEWNNLLHGLVEHVIQMVLSGDSTPLKTTLFKRAHIMECILQAHLRNTELSRHETGTRLGFMGHITRISNTIVDQASHDQVLESFCLESDDWREFCEGQLALENENLNIQLGGHRPDGSLIEDSEDDIPESTYEDNVFSPTTVSYTDDGDFDDDDMPAEFNYQMPGSQGFFEGDPSQQGADGQPQQTDGGPQGADAAAFTDEEWAELNSTFRPGSPTDAEQQGPAMGESGMNDDDWAKFDSFEEGDNPNSADGSPSAAEVAAASIHNDHGSGGADGSTTGITQAFSKMFLEESEESNANSTSESPATSADSSSAVADGDAAPKLNGEPSSDAVAAESSEVPATKASPTASTES